MPRRGGLPLFCFVAERLYSVARRSGYQRGRQMQLISFIRLLYAADPKKRIFLVEVVACYAFLFTFAAVIAIIKI